MRITEITQPSDVDVDLIKAAKEHFGQTGHPEEVGYILPDGTMLDLSGRHQTGEYRRDAAGRNIVHRGVDYFAGRRFTDHRELDDLVDADGTDGMLEFMRRANAVRVMPRVGFSVVRLPTIKAIAKMTAVAQAWNEPIYIDFGEEATDVDPPFKPAKMVAALQQLGLLRK